MSNIESVEDKKNFMDRSHQRSVLQKSVFILLHCLIILFCAWLILGQGIEELGKLSGFQLRVYDRTRAIIVLACAVLYFVRHIITLFYLFVRKVTWSESLGLVVFMLFFEVGFLLIAAGIFREEAVVFNNWDMIALLFLLLGSFLNTFSEMQRKWWKADIRNKGHCYTLGLFQYSMHINFFGDVVLFSGWALLTACLWSLLLPFLMMSMFIFFHIPDLDRYLSKRYGQEFDAYASKTKKLIPFVY